MFRFNKFPRAWVKEPIFRGPERWQGAQSFLGRLQASNRFNPDRPLVIRICSKNIVRAIHVVSPAETFYGVTKSRVFLVGNENCLKQRAEAATGCCRSRCTTSASGTHY